jgi:HAD superfamily hydrolase (TIGR01450 family)
VQHPPDRDLLSTVHCPLSTPYSGYLFDLDGTVYLGEALLPGAARTIAGLRADGRRVLFLSNNPTRDAAEVAAKLTALGIPAGPGDVLNTVETMTRWLQLHHPTATVFPIAEAPLWRALAAAGIRLSEDPAAIDVVVASYDRSFDYRKLQVAFDAIWQHKRAILVTTNPDRYCPFPGGRGEPDAAAIVAAIEASTGVRCIQNVGKPDPFMLESALAKLDLPAAACLMVGDRLSTDIAMARAAGMASALVLTGETTAEMLADILPEQHPTYVLTRLDEIRPSSAAKHG